MPATYEPISTTTVTGSSTATITFSSIPATYTDIVLVGYTNGSRTTYGGDFQIQFNNDTTGNYDMIIMSGTGSSVTANRYANQQSINMGPLGPNGTSEFNFTLCHINNYTSTNGHKPIYSVTSGQSQAVIRVHGVWTNSAQAINRIDLTGNTYNFNVGTTVTLYGILKA